MSLCGSSDGDKTRFPVLSKSKFSAHCERVALSPFLGCDLDGNPVVFWSDGESAIGTMATGGRLSVCLWRYNTYTQFTTKAGSILCVLGIYLSVFI